MIEIAGAFLINMKIKVLGIYSNPLHRFQNQSIKNTPGICAQLTFLEVLIYFEQRFGYSDNPFDRNMTLRDICVNVNVGHHGPQVSLHSGEKKSDFLLVHETCFTITITIYCCDITNYKITTITILYIPTDVSTKLPTFWPKSSNSPASEWRSN